MTQKVKKLLPAVRAGTVDLYPAGADEIQGTGGFPFDEQDLILAVLGHEYPGGQGLQTGVAKLGKEGDLPQDGHRLPWFQHGITLPGAAGG